MMNEENRLEKHRKHIHRIIEIGAFDDTISRVYDFISVFAIVLNLLISVLATYEPIWQAHKGALLAAESVTVAAFAVDYALRLWTAKYQFPELKERRAVARYACSFTGVVDLLSFLPFLLPRLFPVGAVAFRMFRVVRIFRLFRINAYYDSLNVITEVISSKRQQLISSVFIILVLMLGASLCMYDLEHAAQPEVFSNAFSGIWWAASTLLTVGYGDIYPITPVGKIFGICITFLGVGMVAIPTGIISAGFVEQYSRLKQLSELAAEEDIHFIKFALTRKDKWVGRTVAELDLPERTIVAAIRRGEEIIVPRGDVCLLKGDVLVLGAEPVRDDRPIDLKEIVLQSQNPWNGQRIRDLDLSRQSLIVMVKRGNSSLVPSGDLQLMAGDTLVLYSRKSISGARGIEV